MEISIQFNQVDPDAKRDSTLTATDKQPWVNMDDLKRDDIVPPNVMTLEHNQAILDGTMDEFPNNPSTYGWGLITLSQSNSQGIFTTPPIIDVTFKGLRSSLGLTLFFYPWTQDWASSVRITWYEDDMTTAIKSGVYELTSITGAISEPIEGFRRIMIELLTTNIPYRFVKIYSIEYGTLKAFDDEDIDAANLLEEIDPISDFLSINTFGFSTRTHEMLFSPISGQAADNMFMKRQSMTVTADNKTFGTFFLDTWRGNSSGTVFNFQAIDAIGVMDGYRFMGDIYANVLASDIIQQLFDLCFPTGLIKYQFDSEFAAARVTGLIPICTAREALQYICFAIGAVADTSRRNYVWIYKRDTEKTFDIPRNKIYPGGSHEPTQYFNGVDLTAYAYITTTESQEVHNGTLAMGQYTFEFSEPLHTITATGAAILIKTANYATINVTTAGVVVLRGNRYLKSEQIHSIRADVEAGQQSNICIFNGATLVDNAKAPMLAADLWDYVSQRISLNNEVRLDSLEVGYVAEVETYLKPVVGAIESLDINMRGGKAKMKAVGNVGERYIPTSMSELTHEQLSVYTHEQLSSFTHGTA